MDSTTIHFLNRISLMVCPHKNRKEQKTSWRQDRSKESRSSLMSLTSLSTSPSKSIPFNKIDNPWLNLSIETIIYHKRLIMNSLSMDWEPKKMSMELRKPFTQELTCLKIKKLDKCISSLMKILMLENKRKEIINGMLIPQISGSEK